MCSSFSSLETKAPMAICMYPSTFFQTKSLHCFPFVVHLYIMNLIMSLTVASQTEQLVQCYLTEVTFICIPPLVVLVHDGWIGCLFRQR